MSYLCARPVLSYRPRMVTGSSAQAQGLDSTPSTATLDSLPDVLTVAEVAKVLRIGRNAAYDSIQRGEIPSVRFGRRIVVPKAALMALLMGASSSGEGH